MPEARVPIDVFLMVLGAALVHATWNALVKTDSDRLALIRVMSLSQIVLSLALAALRRRPRRRRAGPIWRRAWCWAPATCCSSIAPTRRPTSASSTRWRAARRPSSWPSSRSASWASNSAAPSQLAILLIGLGITSLALARGAASLRDWRPIVLALVTGSFIGAYTIVDGLGVRAAGSAHGYMIWLSLLDARS